MARTPATPAADGSAKPKRVVNPNKTLYVMLQPGTDPAAAKAMISSVTTNSRALIASLTGGEPAPFITFTLKAEPRSKGEE